MVEKDRRHSVRIPARLEVQYQADGIEAAGFIDDLSEAGAWIDTQQPLPVGSQVDFEFRLHDEQEDEPVTGRAHVVRSESDVGMAVEFLNLGTALHDRLRFYVATVFFGRDTEERD